jgi:hypothetical protein
VHRVDEAQPVLDAGIAHECLDAIGDVDVVATMRRLERQEMDGVASSARG